MKLKLKRIAPGFYETLDGKYTVRGFQRPERNAYGSAGEWMWYWLEENGLHGGGDQYYTKRDAVEALTCWIVDHDGGHHA